MSGPSERQVTAPAFGAGRGWFYYTRLVYQSLLVKNADTQVSKRLCSQAAGAGDMQQSIMLMSYKQLEYSAQCAPHTFLLTARFWMSSWP